MTEKKNIVASVLARLRNTAKSSGAPFQQILQQYAMERFLHRVSRSPHAQTVILKGALLLKTIGIPRARPTMDIDMLRKGKADQASLIALVKDCATIEVEPDGLTFLADSVVAEEIKKDSEHKGTRILMDARMDKVRLRNQVDFGVGAFPHDCVFSSLRYFRRQSRCSRRLAGVRASAVRNFFLYPRSSRTTCFPCAEIVTNVSLMMFL